jgi:hypothetical protein
MERIWYRDPSGLFTAANWGSVIPLTGMTFAQQLNSVVRLSLLYAAALALLRRNLTYLAVPVAACLVTYALYRNIESRGGEDAAAERSLFAEGRGIRRGLQDGCRVPTRDNPFMNKNFTDEPGAPGSCDVLRPEVQAEMQRKYSEGMYRDVDDLWGSRTAARQFVTTPVTDVISDQAAFGEWLYGDMRRTAGKQSRPPTNSL